MERLLKRRAAGESGFTLIELLVVIAILAVLAGVVVLSLSGFNDDSKETACEIDERTVRTAAEAYRAELGSYPPNMNAMVADGFLSEASTYTDYAFVAGPPESFTVTPDPVECP